MKADIDKANKELDATGLNCAITEEDILKVISKITGIPLNKIASEEAAKLRNLEKELMKYVINQDKAVSTLSKAIRKARAGFKDPNHPVGSFLFVGPTGVGKTLVSKTLADLMFNSHDAMIRIDCSELMEQHSISKLIGSPPGYVGYDEGGQLTERVRNHPHSLILFDEVEKAHPQVFNALLQVMDEGHLTDSAGRKVDFRNTIIIMTSNIGSEHVKNKPSFGFSQADAMDADRIATLITGSISKHFRPEFINRIDQTVMFKPISKDDLGQIIDIELGHINGRLKNKGLTMVVNEDARKWLIEKGYNPEFGARPLKRVLSDNIESKLSDLVFSEEKFEKVEVSVENNELKFVTV